MNMGPCIGVTAESFWSVQKKKKKKRIRKLVWNKNRKMMEKKTEEWAVDALKWNENRFRAVT